MKVYINIYFLGSCVYVDGSKQFRQGEHMWCVDVVDAIYFTIGECGIFSTQ